MASIPLSRNTILEHLNVFDEDFVCHSPKLLYGKWLISHKKLPDSNLTPLNTSEVVSLMMESRLAMDNIYDSDILEQVIAAPYAYGKISQSKCLLATSPVTNET
jgi:hypothetical protein